MEHDEQLHSPEQRLRRPVGFADAGEPVGAEDRAVVQAPGDEGPARAVPEAAQQHREHQVAVLASRPCRLPPSGMYR